MEDKTITNQESLDLIARMIRNTQHNIEPGDGGPFLIWGYTTFLTSLLVWGLWCFTENALVNWVWFAIPLFGGVWTYLVRRKNPRQVKTFLDRVIANVWITLGGAAFGIALMVMLVDYRIPVLAIIAILIFSGQAITGGIIRMKSIQYTGYVGILLSFGLFYLQGFPSLWAFGGLFGIIMVIPGHIMNIQSRKANTPSS